MDVRTLLVPADSPLLRDRTTVRLHQYPNGDILIRTRAVDVEFGENDALPVAGGLRIAGISDARLQTLRDGTLNVPPQNGKKAKVASETIKASAKPAGERASASILAYVELIGPVDPAWIAALKELSIEPLRYHPENTYLCSAPDSSSFQLARKLDFVNSVVPLEDALKPAIALMAEDGEEAQILVQGLVADSTALISQLGSLPGVELHSLIEAEQSGFYFRLRARLTLEGQAALLKQPRIVAVEKFVSVHSEDEVADLIICGQYTLPGRPNGSYMKWLEDQGISGDGVTIGIVDAGIDTTHAAFRGRITDLTAGNKSWHGTFVAGHAAGAYLAEKDSNQFIYGLGLAPAANLLSQDNSLSATVLCRQTVTQKAPSGVSGIVQNNSWGKGMQDPMDYSSDEATYDGLVRNADSGESVPKPLTICFSSGNSGSAGLTRPKAAKNVIITGNSENYRPDVGREQSDNINDIFTGTHASSWGNCGDGRIRPHMVAPGEWTSSANYDSHVGEAEYISPQLTWGGGSSGASPKTAAACALLIDWWRNHHGRADPSPALLRALLVNGAEPLVAGGPIPNKIQGWGRVHLGNVVDQNVARIHSDQEFLLHQLGDQKTWNIVVADSAKPLKVTLAWTDPPGPVGSGSTPAISPIVNKLALRVENGTTIYRGNRFEQGWSVAGSSASSEGLDNLQNIFINAGQLSGPLRVTVSALNITTNCMTDRIDSPQQDFALVISNGRLDGASSGSDVAVLVDRAATGDPKSGSAGDYWKPAPGNSDLDHLNQNLWDNTSPVTSSALNPTPNSGPALDDPSSSAEEDDWWSQVDSFWNGEPAGESEKLPVTSSTAFVGGLSAGFDLAAGAGRDVRTSATTPAPEFGEGGEKTDLITVSTNAIRHASAADLALGTAVDLPGALAQLLDAWTKPSVAAQNSSVRRRVAVLVLGSGTRVSKGDIGGLLTLTMLGTLYIVSTDPRLLAFLAQRVHRTRGIQLRLATDAADLPNVVRDAVGDAAGLQQLGVQTLSATASGIVTSTCKFNVLDADLRLTVQITWSPQRPLSGVRVRYPGTLKAEILKPVNTPASVARPGFVQFSLPIPSSKLHWAGTWEVEVDLNGVDLATAAAVSVWAETLLEIDAIERDPSVGGTGTGEDALIVISGNQGVQLSRCVLKPARIATREAYKTGEVLRDTVTTALLPRLALQGAAPMQEKSRDVARAPVLSQWVSFPKVPDSATVMDLRFEVQGADARGHLFERVLRRNVFRFEPKSDWRKRLAKVPGLPLPKALLIAAQVEDIDYDNGAVVGMRIRRDSKRKHVSVTSPVLRHELARLSLQELQHKSCSVRVLGSTLVGLLITLDDNCRTTTNKHRKTTRRMK